MHLQPGFAGGDVSHALRLHLHRGVLLDLALLPPPLLLQDVPVEHVVVFEAPLGKEVFEVSAEEVVVGLLVELERSAVFHEVDEFYGNSLFGLGGEVCGCRLALPGLSIVFYFHLDQLLYGGIELHVLDDFVLFIPGLSLDSLPGQSTLEEVNKDEA